MNDDYGFGHDPYEPIDYNTPDYGGGGTSDYVDDTPAPGPGDYSNYNPGDTYSGPVRDLAAQDPSIMQYLSQFLKLPVSEIAKLITAAGGVAQLVTGLHQGDKAIDRLVQSAGETQQRNYGAADRTQALGNPDATNVYGSRKWGAPGPDGRPTYTDTLSPEQQRLYEQDTGLSERGNVLAGKAYDQVDANLSKPFGLAGEVPMADMGRMGKGIQEDVDFSKAGNIQLDANRYGSIQNDPGQRGKIQFDPGQRGKIQFDPGQAGDIQSDLDYSGAPAMPVADAALQKQVTDDVIAQHKPAFDQQWNEQIRAMDERLRGEGMPPESPAYVAQMKRIIDDKGTAWNELMRGATAEGLSAMGVRFNQNMASRQEGVGEINTKGGFHNAAQGQGAEQLLAWQAAHNQAQGLDANQLLAWQAAHNQAQGLDADQLLAWQAAHNQAQNQGQGQEFQFQGTHNAAQGQGAGQIYQAGQFHNAAQGQGTDQYLAGIKANQSGRAQQFNEYTTGYSAPAFLANFLRGKPTVPNFGTPTGATVGQATYNPLGTTTAINTVDAGNTENINRTINRFTT